MASVATGADIATSVGTRRRRYMERKSLLALLLFLPPALILFTLFIVLPMVDAATFSFFDWNGYGPITDFVGFENYADVLTHRNFGTAVRNSLIVVAVSLVIQLPLAMWCAIALSERGVHINVLRTLFFLPFMLAEVAAGLIWKFVYDGNYGLLPAIGDGIGVDMPFVLGDKLWVIPAIMLVITWKYFGFHMMIYIAGLQSIPNHVYEVASLDGASPTRTFWSITMPLLRPVLVLVLVVTVIGSFQVFDTVAVTTGGGPINASRVIQMYIYQKAFGESDFGYASALSVILFVILALVAFIQMKFLKGDESDLD
ncbi:MAG: sugar ABC transporter permease [Devosia sp.]|nr:sugar ABC transporter permease [Devosia sp.]